MNDYEMVRFFENIRKNKLAILKTLKSDREYLKMIAEILINIECELKKLSLNATREL